MERITILDAVLHVLRDSKTPMTGKQIYDEVCMRGLYQFKAKDPLAVMMAQVRRHCEGNTAKKAAPTKYFICDDGFPPTFRLLDRR